MMKIDVIVPVYEPNEKFKKLLRALSMQTLRPVQIILTHTEDGCDISYAKEICEGINVKEIMIRKDAFDHGGTRDLAIKESQADIVVLMTQDAVPTDKYLIEHLVEVFQNDEDIVVSYARQKAGKESDVIEQYARHFNYPMESMVKTKADLKRLGIKTFFCSDVCAAYRRDIYLELGGFEKHIIFNEDMVFAANVIEQGFKIAYVANAVVVHAHNYTYIRQLKRNFDQGVSQTEYSQIFGKVRSESEGIRLVRQTVFYLIKKKKPLQIIRLINLSAGKYIGFRLGKCYRKLPNWLIMKLTMNPEYWKRGGNGNEN